jgi:hypothetical protein
MNDIVQLDRWVDAVYSPDDGGWYLHNYATGECSPIFRSLAQAKIAYRKGEVNA